MTDNGVVQTLESIIRRYKDAAHHVSCIVNINILKEALDTIKEQKAEIERLKGSVITNNIMEIQKIKREAKLEVINEFEKEIKYVKENEKYDDFNPIVDIDLCENVLNITKLQNEKIKKLNIKNKELSILINMQEKTIREQQVIIDTLRILNKSAKSEAIKEFEEELEYFILNEDVEIVKPKCKYYGSYINGANQFRHQIKNGIKKLVKEMTEVSE